jgi:hypothetical protein
MGPNNRSKSVDFLRDQYRDWRSVKIIAFDAPQARDQAYTQRLEILKQGMLCTKSFLPFLFISSIPSQQPAVYCNLTGFV